MCIGALYSLGLGVHSSVNITMEIRAGTNVVYLRLDRARNPDTPARRVD